MPSKNWASPFSFLKLLLMFVVDVFQMKNKIKLKDKMKIKQYSNGWIASKCQAIFLTYFCCCFAIGSDRQNESGRYDDQSHLVTLY